MEKLPKELFLQKAVFSDDKEKTYRYTLTRTTQNLYASLGVCTFVMLNPSTADEHQNDPTVTGCIKYATSWGFGMLIVVNIFALRSTDPKKLYDHDNPVGRLNDEAILRAANFTHRNSDGIIVCAWGDHGIHLNRGKHVMDLLKDHPLYCLKTNKNRQPTHPLYLKRSLKPTLLKR